MEREALKLELERLADRFSEGWHEGIKIDASDIMLLTEAAQVLAQEPVASLCEIKEVDKTYSAARTLQHLGYTDCGGELWKPPLGTAAQPAQEPASVTYKEVQYSMNALEEGNLRQQAIAEELGQRKLYTTPPQPAQEPVCPACKAGVLYECVACSSNNYPPQGAQKPVAWMYDWLCEGKLITGWIAHSDSEIPQLMGSNIRPLYTAPPHRTEPPDWFPAVENILKEYGLQAMDFVADFKKAMKDAEQSQRTEQEPVAWAVYDKRGGSKSLHWPDQHSPDGDATMFDAVPLVPQRTWVEPTVGEWFEWWRVSPIADSTEAEIDFADFLIIAQAVVANLKDKNNG